VKNIKNQGVGLRQEILVAVNLKNLVLWFVTSCNLVDAYNNIAVYID